jgi:hypothetical protein
MPGKRKTLPKDFKELLAAGDLDVLLEVFDDCELDAHVRGSKNIALHFAECPNELIRWLVARGLDVDTPSEFGDTALSQRAHHDHQDDSALLELGANVNATNRYGYTPLHHAVPRSPRKVRAFLSLGADMRAENDEGHPPLESALARCNNSEIVAVAESAQILIDAGSPVPDNAAEHVTRIGEQYERLRRDGYRRERTDRARADLYAMFDITPVAARRVHDGTSTITVSATQWPDQFNELWDFLVPRSGTAATTQGEVIRLAGRMSNELRGNGGINWDRDYRTMKDALIAHLGAGTPVTTDSELADLAPGIQRDFDEYAVRHLVELAVAWVLANPDPVPLPLPVKYDR